MEDQENLTPSQMLTLIQEMLVNNARAVENLESAERELDVSRNKCNDTLNNHYDLVTKMLKEVHESGAEEVATQYETKKEDLKRKKKYLTRCSLALMPELDNLRSSGQNAVDAARRCKEILAKLTKVVDLQNADARVTFNFIPKIGKIKLGFLQLCNNFPQDFTLRLLTPIMNIRLGQQIHCGIEGNLTAENVRHLEFGIRRNNILVPSLNLGTQGDVFKFGFSADLGGVYVILACLFGTPIAHSPLTLTIHTSDNPPPAVRALASHVAVSSPAACALASHVDASSSAVRALASHDEVSFPASGALASHVEVSSNAVEFKLSEAAEGDYDEISGPVQEAHSGKASTKIVQGHEGKSPMRLEYALAHNQIKDDRNTDVNRNSKDISLSYKCKGKKNSVNAEENNVIKESTKAAKSKVNNNDLSGAKFKVGDECVALWKDGMWYNGLIEATNSDGSLHVKFVDYGNSGDIALDDIVKSAPDIPEDVPDYDVDDNVGSRIAKKGLRDSTFRKKIKENDIEDVRKFREDLDTNKNVDESLSTKNAVKDHSPSKVGKVFQVGDVCVAKWSEDQVWYNGIVKNIGKDGSYNVIFTDYGNNDYVNEQFIVTEASSISPGENVDENVNVGQISSRNLGRKENNENSYQASQAEENVSRKDPSGVTKKVETSKKTLSAPGQATSLSEKAAVPIVMKTIIPECDKFGDSGDKENSRDGRENKDLKGSLPNVKAETLIKKRRNKSKPPVPRPLESNLGTKLNAAPMLLKKEESGWKTGDACLAKWSEDGVWYRAVVNSKETQFSQDGGFEVLYNVTFTDYGNKDQVRAAQMVKDHKEFIQSGVEAIFDGNVNIDFANVIDGNRLWKIGEVGIARWDNDNIWYNAKIENVNVDGSFDVLFVDYGNTDTVKMPFFVKNTSMIEDTGEEILLDVNIDVHVKEGVATDKGFTINSDSPSHFPLPITSSNTPVDVNREFIYPDVEDKAFPSSNAGKTQDVKSSKTSDGSTFSGRSLAFKSNKTKIKPFNILKHMTTTKEGRREMVIKCVLKVGENISSPIGMTVLQNKSVIIGSAVDESAKILRPDGTLLAPVNSVRQFVKPTDMATLSSGEFVIRDDLGLQLFSEDGVYIKSCGARQIDKCFGLAEDEGGNIITINWAQPSRSSKPGSKGNGGLTDVGETDVFFISRETGEVVKRIELTDIISDKIKSKCRFLRYHNNTLYIVDIGLDCIYKLKTDCNEVSVVGGTGTGPNKFRDPAGIVVDDFGNFIVADSKNHRLQIFDQDENFIGFVALDLPIRRPSGIFLDKEQGELYVLNYWGNNSMVKYRVSGSRD